MDDEEKRNSISESCNFMISSKLMTPDLTKITPNLLGVGLM